MVQMQQEQLTELFTLRLMRGQMTQETLQSNLELLHITPRKFMSVILLAVSSHREGRDVYKRQLLYRISMVKGKRKDRPTGLSYWKSTYKCSRFLSPV